METEVVDFEPVGRGREGCVVELLVINGWVRQDRIDRWVGG